MTNINYQTVVQPDRVHASVYTRDEVFNDELNKLFYNNWVFIGHASEVAKTGDYVRRQIGQQPVLMVRDREGGIQVLLNRCPHRGNMLCWKDSGNTKKAITCSYHGWTFDLKGKLLAVQHPGGFEQQKESLGLGKATEVAQYRGFVFASLNAPKSTFDEYLGKGKSLIDRTCDLSPEGEIELGAGWLRHKVNANWKMVAENNTDGYHVGFVHASYLDSFNSQYATAVGQTEESILGHTRDWGNGHNELEFAQAYSTVTTSLNSPKPIPNSSTGWVAS